MKLIIELTLARFCVTYIKVYKKYMVWIYVKKKFRFYYLCSFECNWYLPSKFPALKLMRYLICITSFVHTKQIVDLATAISDDTGPEWKMKCSWLCKRS